MSNSHGIKWAATVHIVDNDETYSDFGGGSGTIAALKIATAAADGYVPCGKGLTYALVNTVANAPEDGVVTPGNKVEQLKKFTFTVAGQDAETDNTTRAAIIALDGTNKNLYIFDDERGDASMAQECLGYTLNVWIDEESKRQEFIMIEATENKNGSTNKLALALT